jgi:hypothetical protein
VGKSESAPLQQLCTHIHNFLLRYDLLTAFSVSSRSAEASTIPSFSFSGGEGGGGGSRLRRLERAAEATTVPSFSTTSYPTSSFRSSSWATRPSALVALRSHSSPSPSSSSSPPSSFTRGCRGVSMHPLRGWGGRLGSPVSREEKGHALGGGVLVVEALARRVYSQVSSLHIYRCSEDTNIYSRTVLYTYSGSNEVLVSLSVRADERKGPPRVF